MASGQDSWLSSALGVDVGGIVSKVESAASSAVDTVESAASSAVDTVESAAGTAMAAVASTASSAASTLVDDAKAAGSAVEAAADTAWNGAKVVGGAIEDAAKQKYQEMKQAGALVKKAEGYADEGIDWAEKEIKSGTRFVADEAKGIPVLEQVAKGAETVVDSEVDLVGGVDKAVVGMVGGVVGAVANPVDTAKALYTMGEHVPVLGTPAKILDEAYQVATTDKTLKQAAEEVADPGDDAKYWGKVGKGLWQPIQKSIDDGKPMEGVGQAAAQIGSLFIGAGEVGAAGEVAEVAGTASKVADVADLADLADVADAADAAKATDAADVAETADAADAAANVKAPVEEPMPAEIEREPVSEGGADEAGSAESGDQPPEDDYDVEGWNKYYERHPDVKRSVGAAGENDPAFAKGAADAEDAEAAEDAQAAEEAAPAEKPYNGGKRARSAASREGIAARKKIGAERLASEQYDPFQDYLEADERDAFIESGGKEVPPGTQMHHTQQTAADPGMADVPQHIQPVTKAEHIPGEHVPNTRDVPTAGLRRDVTTPRDPIFDPNAEPPAGSVNQGMMSDARRLKDSTTGEPVPALGNSAEDANLTARPRDQSLDDILNEQAQRNFSDEEDALIDAIDSSSELERELEHK